MNTSRTCLNCHGENVPLLADYCPRCGSDDLTRVDPPEYMVERQASHTFLNFPTPFRRCLLCCWIVAAVTISAVVFVELLRFRAEAQSLSFVQYLGFFWEHIAGVFWWSLAVTLIWLLLIPLSDWTRGPQD